VDRRLVLAIAWAACALVAAAVGFGAANLVGNAIEDIPLASGGSPAVATETPTSSPRVTTGAPTATPTGTTRIAAPAVRRGTKATTGGVVSATCTSGRVVVSASPASGWRLDNWTTGSVTEAQVEFRRNEAKVEVRARCGASGPVFQVETGTSGGGGGGSGSGSGG
jgi:hypothetical protein